MVNICGIFGFCGKFDVDIVERLFISHQARGKDAAGLAYITDKSMVYIKNGVMPISFVKEGHVKGIKESPSLMVCHTRAATKGDKSNNVNNHPFIDKSTKVALVHNGIISNYDEIIAKEKFKLDGECDSEVILALVSKFLNKGLTITQSITKMLGIVQGSYNLAILHESKIYVYCNGNINLIKKGNTIYFCQTGESILGMKDGVFWNMTYRKMYDNELATLCVEDGIPEVSIREVKVKKDKSYEHKYGYTYWRNGVEVDLFDDGVAECGNNELVPVVPKIETSTPQVSVIDNTTKKRAWKYDDGEWSKYCTVIGSYCTTPKKCNACVMKRLFLESMRANN